MTLDRPAIRAYTHGIQRARLAYRAQPIATDVGGRLPCLGACGRYPSKGRPYCNICRLIWGKKK